MKTKILLISILMFFQVSLFAQQNEILTNESVISLVEFGFESDVINSKILASEANFDTSIAALQILKENNVPSDIIETMINHQPKVINTEAIIIAQNNDTEADNATQYMPKSNTHKRIIWDINAGLNVSTFAGKGLESYSSSSRLGFHMGLSVQLIISKSTPIYFGYGFYFSQKGSKYKFGELVTINIRPLYLDMPIFIRYKIELDNNFSITPSFGIYLSRGISGDIEVDVAPELEAEFEAETLESVSLFDADNGPFKGTDIGLDIGVVVAWKRVNLSLGYEYGFTDISRDESAEFKNRTFTISAGYNF